MTRLIDADALIEPLKEEYKKVKQAFDETSVFKAPNDVALYGALMQEVGAVIGMIEDAKTVDAVPLDGSFLKMSRGDYLIYKRHWLYEHFDQEIDIQRSVMKSMGYEPALKDTEPHWIPCSDRLPEKDGYYLTTTCYRQVYRDFWNEDHFDRTEAVIAWMPLPKPYEVEE